MNPEHYEQRIKNLELTVAQLLENQKIAANTLTKASDSLSEFYGCFSDTTMAILKQNQHLSRLIVAGFPLTDERVSEELRTLLSRIETHNERFEAGLSNLARNIGKLRIDPPLPGC